MLRLSLCCLAAAALAAGAQSAPSAAQVTPRPGDRVVMRVLGEPTLSALSDTGTVDERGWVALPKIGNVNAASMTIAEFRDTVRARVTGLVRDAAVDVAVLRRVVVVGEVEKPGVYFLDLTESIAEAIAKAGGIKESGVTGTVYIVRNDTRLPVTRWESKSPSTDDLRSGDRILVARKSWLALNMIPLASVSTSILALIISLTK